MERHYYRYKGVYPYGWNGNFDTIWECKGYIFKCLTEEQARHYTEDCHEVWEKVEVLKGNDD